MRIRMAGVAALIAVSAAAAEAQTWQDAYGRRDYPTAASLLQAEVFEHPAHGGSRYPDIQAIQTLAQMYADGQGVPRDGLTACALSNLGSGAAVYRHGERHAKTIEIQRQVEALCVPLSAAERRDAMEANRCFQQGPAPSVLWESPMRKVEVSRTGLTVVQRGKTREHALAPLLRCAQQVPEVRHVRVPAPKGTKLAAREFVEIYSWHSGYKDGRRLRTLEWSAIELTGQSAELRARTILERGEGSAWPSRSVPEEFARPVTFAMNKAGDVRWQMPGRPGLHGLIGRPATLRAAR